MDATDGMTRGPNVSVVCPFYNESAIIEHSIRNLAANLERLDCDWELLVVNDGSTDDSDDIARRVAAEYPRVRVLGYSRNKGRGAALLTGINEARGAIIVTTEIDLSWGESIVHDLLAAMHACPEADIVVASPHLPGGGYRNVPVKRVLLSRFGNRVIRACMSNVATMNTGMTRAYRRDAIMSLPLHEPGKEFHLEVILKATALGYRIHEIPAVLEWKDYKQAGERRKRKSSAGRPPVSTSNRPRPSTRPVRSSARRKFCLCSRTPETASTVRWSRERVNSGGVSSKATGRYFILPRNRPSPVARMRR